MNIADQIHDKVRIIKELVYEKDEYVTLENAEYAARMLNDDLFQDVLPPVFHVSRGRIR